MTLNDNMIAHMQMVEMEAPVQVALDEALFGPLHVLGFFTFMTKAEGGSWQVCHFGLQSPMSAFESRQSIMMSTEYYLLVPLNEHDVQDVKEKIQQDFLSTYVAELAIWPAYQTFNFAKVPVRHQLLFVNSGCLIDATFLCW